MLHCAWYLIIAFVYLGIFWILGTLPGKKYGSESVAVTALLGFLIYFSYLQIIGVPLKLLGCSLTVFGRIWMSGLLLLMSFAFFLRRSIMKEMLERIVTERNRWMSLCIFFIGSLGIGVILALNVDNLSAYDAVTYLGIPTSSVYSDSLERMSAYTGLMLDAADHYYILNTDMLHSAVISKLLGILASVERQFIFTIAMVCLFEMGIYKCACYFSEKKLWKEITFWFLSNLVLLYSYSIAGVSHYFAYRTYEGKSVVSYFYMLLIFLFSVSFYKEERSKWGYTGLFLCSVSGMAFCNTALFVIPMAIACMMTPYSLEKSMREKKIWALLKLIVVLTPCLFWIILHEVI